MDIMTFPCAFGYASIATTDGLLCGVGIRDYSHVPEALFDQLTVNYAICGVRPDPRVVEQVLSIVNGETIQKDLMDLLFVNATKFQMKVWHALRSIPHGQTATYTDIAQQIGMPTAVRAVATAIGKNPVAIIIPCHRVIRSDGKIGGYRWGTDLKQKLLDREKITT